MKVSAFITLTKVNDGKTGSKGDKGERGPAGTNYWITQQWIDVSDTTKYKEDTWYPVVGTMLPSTGACRTKVSVQLNSGSKPSWSTHSSGFAVDFDVQDQRAGWGTTNAKCLIFLDTFNWVQGSESPVSYTQMTKDSLPVLFLRGGGKYHVSTDYQVTWQVHDKDYTWTSGNYSETVTISKTRPTPKGQSVQGSDGKDGKSCKPINEYALINEGAIPNSSTSWNEALPSPWYLGLEYWTRIKYVWSDGAIAYSSAQKCVDANALMLSTATFDISFTPKTYEINLRDETQFLIEFKASYSAYQNAAVTWTVNGEVYDDDGNGLTLASKRNTAPKSIKGNAKLNYTRAGKPDSIVLSFEINGIDVTDYTRCYGLKTTNPTVNDVLHGDCYVKQSGVDYIPMVYQNGTWVPITAENMATFLDAMSKCGNAVILDGKDIPKTSTAMYAYFSSLFAKSANIDFISTQDIQIRDKGVIRSTGKTAIGDGKSGFIIKSDGTSEFVGAVIKNADLSETRIERLDADVLRTVNTTVSGEKYTGRLDTTKYWNLGAAVSDAIGKSSANNITLKSGALHVEHAEGETLDADFSAVLSITSEAARTADKSLLSQSVDGSNSGTSYTVPSLPNKVQSSIKIGGSRYLAKIEATGASCYGTKQYSIDGSNWTNYDTLEFGYEAIKGKTIRLRQVLTGGLYDVNSCTRTKADSTLSDTMHANSAIGNGRMVISNRGKLISFPIDNPSSVSVTTLPNAYNCCYGGMAYGNGIFLASVSGSVQKRLLSGGATGTSWTELSTENYEGLFFANGYFHAHKSGAPSDTWVKSTDGRSWSADSFSYIDPYGLPNSIINTSICYGDGVYLMVCYVKWEASKIYRSTDGSHWATVSPGATNISGLAYQNNLFIAHEMKSNTYYISGDKGITWQKKTHLYTPQNLTSICGYDSTFYGADSEGYIYTFPIENASPTTTITGSVTAVYNYKSYDLGLNLLDGNGKKLISLGTGESYYTGTFLYNGEDMTSSLSYYYKFGGVYKGNTKILSGSFDMFTSISVTWNRIHNTKDSYSKKPSVITWSGTSVTIINADNTNARIRSNDLFSALSLVFQVISEAKGAYTKDLYPQESDVYDIGSATKKYDQIHAKQLNGLLVGNVQGDLKGNSNGTHTGDVNSQGTTNKVWGAVWN